MVHASPSRRCALRVAASSRCCDLLLSRLVSSPLLCSSLLSSAAQICRRRSAAPPLLRSAPQHSTAQHIAYTRVKLTGAQTPTATEKRTPRSIVIASASESAALVQVAAAAPSADSVCSAAPPSACAIIATHAVCSVRCSLRLSPPSLALPRSSPPLPVVSALRSLLRSPHARRLTTPLLTRRPVAPPLALTRRSFLHTRINMAAPASAASSSSSSQPVSAPHSASTSAAALARDSVPSLSTTSIWAVESGAQSSATTAAATASVYPALSGSLSGFDVCVIGAGIVGASAAYECAKAGLKVAILEARDAGTGTTGWSVAHAREAQNKARAQSIIQRNGSLGRGSGSLLPRSLLSRLSLRRRSTAKLTSQQNLIYSTIASQHGKETARLYGQRSAHESDLELRSVLAPSF